MKKTHTWSAADTLTALRIVGALCLLWPPVDSAAFIVIYTLAGMTDVLDGYVARKTNTASTFGARLDSAADLTFYTILFARLMPTLLARLPGVMWCVIGVILVLRAAAYLVAAVRLRRFASLHTYLNKLTGGSIFLLPYVLALCYGVGYCWLVCAVSLASALEELLLQSLLRETDAGVQSLAQLCHRRKAEW